MASEIPSKPGFYWAKWRLADQGDAKTAEYESYLPCDKWEVVDVFVNGGDPADPNFLRVHVPGVDDGQSRENFFWGPGPLLAPGTEVKTPKTVEPRDRFHNTLRILLNIDQDEIGLDGPVWDSFQRDPFRWFIRACDADAEKVWAAVERRQAKRDGAA